MIFPERFCFLSRPVVNCGVSVCAGILVEELCQPDTMVYSRYLKIHFGGAQTERQQQLKIPTPETIAKTRHLDLSLPRKQRGNIENGIGDLQQPSIGAKPFDVRSYFQS